MNKYSLQVQ